MTPLGGTPLTGRRVLVTRSAEQGGDLITRLERAGAGVVHLPAIRFDSPPSWDSLDFLIDTFAEWDWVIFTSANGVGFFAERCRKKGRDPSRAHVPKIAAVGSATADSLRSIDIVADVVPSRFSGTEILALLPDNQQGIRTAVVRALTGRNELIEALRAKGGEVHLAVAYETHGLDAIPGDIRDAIVNGAIDALTFTSPSTVENVLGHLSPEELEHVRERSKFVSIGPTTTTSLRGLGIADVIEARQADIDGLVDAVISALT